MVSNVISVGDAELAKSVEPDHAIHIGCSPDCENGEFVSALSPPPDESMVKAEIAPESAFAT
jgi:hypothetical protein